MENLKTNVSENENLIKMNIQLLASEGESEVSDNDDSTGNVQTDTNDTQENKPAEKTFTQDDLDKILAKKFAQWERKSEQRAAEKAKEVEEAEKLKRMSETERQQAEMKKQLEEYNRMKAEMAREKLNNQVVKELALKNLPVEYAEYVMVDNDAEATMERLSTFAEKYNADVQKEVDRLVQERLRGNAPKAANVQAKTSFTVEDIKNMSPDEINRNWDQIKNVKLN